MPKHTCPRRSEMGLDPTPGKDTWMSRPGKRGKHVCSYCGSMKPDEFMQACRDGSEIGPTDKNYKVYLDGHGSKFYFQHLSEEQRTEFIRLYNDGTLKVGYPGQLYVAPFFTRFISAAE